MIWLYLLLILAGLILTVHLARRRSRQVWVAALGTVLACLAVVTGFSIGPLVALVAAALLALAVVRSRSPARVA